MSEMAGERQNNLPHHLDSTTANSVEKQSVERRSSEQEIKAPDGGWGWVIVIASFFMHLIGW